MVLFRYFQFEVALFNKYFIPEHIKYQQSHPSSSKRSNMRGKALTKSFTGRNQLENHRKKPRVEVDFLVCQLDISRDSIPTCQLGAGFGAVDAASDSLISNTP